MSFGRVEFNPWFVKVSTGKLSRRQGCYRYRLLYWVKA